MYKTALKEDALRLPFAKLFFPKPLTSAEVLQGTEAGSVTLPLAPEKMFP